MCVINDGVLSVTTIPLLWRGWTEGETNQTEECASLEGDVDVAHPTGPGQR